jgi:hypothetical protein
LLRGADDISRWIAAPNPYSVAAGGVLQLFGPSWARLEAGKIYNLAGEWVGAVEAGAAGRAHWAIPAKLASGVYIIVLESRYPGGSLQRQSLRVSLVQ